MRSQIWITLLISVLALPVAANAHNVGHAGRGFTEADDVPGSAATVIISYGCIGRLHWIRSKF